MKRLKLAYIFDQLLPAHTAESEQLINTLSALSFCDFECTLFLPASNTDENSSFEILKEFYHISGTFKVEYIHSIFPGPRILQKAVHPVLCMTLLHKKLKRFDVVYSRNIAAIISALAAGIPAMYDTYRPWPEQYHHVLTPLFKVMFSHPRFLGAALHSEYARDAYLKIGVQPEQTIVAHNGFNPLNFEPRLSKKDARSRLGLSLDRPMALYSGRMDPEKGIDSLLDLAEGSPECDFVFIGSHGNGPLEKRAANSSNIKVLGWLGAQELSIWFYAADVLMLPISKSPLKKAGNTVLPMKVFSYFAAGRTIFAPQSEDLSELLIDGENACLVPQDDPKAALDKFKTLMASPDTLQSLADNAKAFSENLTWQNRGKILSDFMQKRMVALNLAS